MNYSLLAAPLDSLKLHEIHDALCVIIHRSTLSAVLQTTLTIIFKGYNYDPWRKAR